MSFREVSSLDADVTIAVGKKDKAGKPYPKQAEGYFLGSRTVESKKGESKLHFLQTPKGNLGIWGTTDLNRKLAQASVGSMVRITSTGMKPTPNGDMYTYKVEVDPDNSIEVNFSSDSDNASDFESTDADDSNPQYSDDDEADELTAAQARAAHVQGLFNKGKSKTK